MTTGRRILATVLIVLLVASVGALGWYGYSAYKYDKDSNPPTQYQIVTRENYDVFVGAQFYLSPTLVTDGGEVVQGNFLFRSSNSAVVAVDSQGLVSVLTASAEPVTITITDDNTQATATVKLNVFTALYSVYKVTDEQGKQIDSNTTLQFVYGQPRTFNVTTLPEDVQFDANTLEISCNPQEAIEYSTGSNSFTLTVLGIGNGVANLTIHTLGEGDYTLDLNFQCQFVDEALNASLNEQLASSGKQLFSKTDFDSITSLHFGEEVHSVSLDEVDLPALSRIVLEADTVVDITSGISEKVSYRVPSTVFTNYLTDDKWKGISSYIIPFDADARDYDSKYVVYHTDDDHLVQTNAQQPVEFQQFEGIDGWFVYLKWEGELALSFTSVGYRFSYWNDCLGNKISNATVNATSDGMHLYAVWSSKQYKITFVDYEQNDKVLDINYMDEIDSLEEFTPSKDGYKFVGWYMDDDYEIVFDRIYYDIADDLTLYAKYELSIVYDLLIDVSINSADKAQLEERGFKLSGDRAYNNQYRYIAFTVVYRKTLNIPVLTKSDIWNFDGWTLDNTLSGYANPIYDNTCDHQDNYLSSEGYFYAVWTHSVKLEIENGDDYKAYINFGGNDNFITLYYGYTVQQCLEVTGQDIFSDDYFTKNSYGTSWYLEGWYHKNGVTTTQFKPTENISLSNSSFNKLGVYRVYARFYTNITIQNTDGSYLTKGTPSLDYSLSWTLFRNGLVDWIVQQNEQGYYVQIETLSSCGNVRSVLQMIDGSICDVSMGSNRQIDDELSIEYGDAVFQIKLVPKIFTVLFSYNTGEHSGTVTVNYTDLDRDIVLPEFIGNRAKEGYTGYWKLLQGNYYTEVGKGGEMWSIPSDLFGTLQLTAEYRANSYTISLYRYDDVAIKQIGNAPLKVTVTYDSAISEANWTTMLNTAALSFNIPAGYKFDGIFDDNTSTGTQWTQSKVYKYTDDIKLYVRYSSEIWLDHQIVDTHNTVTVYYNLPVGELPNIQSQSSEWDFNGWYTTAGGYQGERVDAEDKVVFSGQKEGFKTVSSRNSTPTLYAKWSRLITVTYKYQEIDFANVVKKIDEFNKFDTTAYTYIYNLTPSQSDEVMSQSNDGYSINRYRDSFNANYGSSGWEYVGLYTQEGGQGTLVSDNYEDNLNGISKLYANFQTTVYYDYQEWSDDDKAFVDKTIEQVYNYGDYPVISVSKWVDVAVKKGYTLTKLEFDSAAFIYTVSSYSVYIVRKAAANAHITLIYTPISYNVTFTYDTGSTVGEMKLTYNDLNRQLTLPEFTGDLHKVGYTGNWQYNGQDVGRGGDAWQVPVDVFEDITLTARYQDNVYTISFIKYDGTALLDGEDAFKVNVDFDQTISSSDWAKLTELSQAQVPANYKFIGWFKSAEVDAEQWNQDTVYTTAGDITLYAKYQTTVMFDTLYQVELSNEQSASLIREGFQLQEISGAENKYLFSYTVRYGETLKLPELEKLGVWSFGGWANEQTIKQFEQALVGNEQQNYTDSTINYYAVWYQDVVLSIDYGAHEQQYAQYLSISDADHTSDDGVIIMKFYRGFSTADNTQRQNIFTDDYFNKTGIGEGWYLLGWFITLEDEEVCIWNKDDRELLEGDFDETELKEIKAHFYTTVTLVGETGEQQTCEVSLNANVTDTLFAEELLAGFAKTGYYVRWQYQDSIWDLVDGVVLDGDTTVEEFVLAYGGATLTVNYAPNLYYVTYNANGGEGIDYDEPTPFVYDQQHSLLLNTDEQLQYYRTGYSFIGWSTQSDATQVDYAIVDGRIVAINITEVRNANITLYAVWKANTYTVTFLGGSDDVTGEMEDQLFVYDEQQAISLNLFAKTGYEFDYWILTDESGVPVMQDGATVTFADGQEVVELSAVADDVLYFTARFKPITFTLQYDFDLDGLTYEVEGITYDDENATALYVKRNGFLFSGWTVVVDGEEIGELIQAGTVISTLRNVKDDVVVLRAKWTLDSYTLVFNTTSRSYQYAINEIFDIDFSGSNYNVKLVGNTLVLWLTDTSMTLLPINMPTAVGTVEGYDYYWDFTFAMQEVAAHLGEEQAGITLHALFVTLGRTYKDYTISYYVNGINVKSITYTIADFTVSSNGERVYDADIYGAFKNRIEDISAPPVDVAGYEFKRWDFSELENALNRTDFVLGDYNVYAILYAPYYTLVFCDENGNPIADKDDCSVWFSYDDRKIELPDCVKALMPFYVWDITEGGLEKVIRESSTKTLMLKGHLINFELKLITSSGVQTYEYTYRNLIGLTSYDETQQAQYFMDFYQVANQIFDKLLMVQGDYTQLTHYDLPDDGLIPFNYQSVTFFALTANETLYVYDANGGVTQGVDGSSYSSIAYVISDTLTFEQAAERIAHRDGYTDYEWEVTVNENGYVLLTVKWIEDETEVPEVEGYTIHFTPEDGVYTPEDLFVEYGKSVTLPSVAKIGYTFKYWATVDGAEFTFNVDRSVSEITLHAVFEINHYTINFYTEQNELWQSVQLTYGESFTVNDLLSASPTKLGYRLQCWQDVRQGNYYLPTSMYDCLTAVDGAVFNFYALWIPAVESNEYFILIYDGTQIIDSIAVQLGNSIVLPVPTKLGYVFSQYNRINGTVLEQKDSYDFEEFFPNVNTHSLNLYAQWDIAYYSVEFYGAQVTAWRTLTTPSGYVLLDNNADAELVAVSELNLVAPYRAGYVGTYNLTEFDFRNTVVYADYNALTYTLSFISDEADAQLSEDLIIAYDNVTVTFPTATLDGKVFVGWQYEGRIYSAGEVIPNFVIPVQGEQTTITLKAVWREYQIFFLDEDGNYVLDGNGNPVTLGKALLGELVAELLAPTVPSKTGYVGYWKIVSVTDTDVFAQAAYMPIVYKVVFEQGNGNDDVEMYVAYGAGNVYPSAERVGYKFVGWTREDGQNVYLAGDVINLTTIAEEITLVAVWQNIGFYVEYDVAAENVATPNRQLVYYDNTEVTFAEPFRKGYLFDGWLDDAQQLYQAGDVIGNLTDTDGAVIQLIAQWTAITYTVQFDTGFEQSIESISVDYDSYFVLPQADQLNRAGYTLVGWQYNGVVYDLTNGDGHALQLNNLIDSNGVTVTLHAVWKVIEYTIHYNIYGYIQDVVWNVEMGEFDLIVPSEGSVWSLSDKEYVAHGGLRVELFDENNELTLYEFYLEDATEIISVTYVYGDGEQIEQKYRFAVGEERKIQLPQIPYLEGYCNGQWNVTVGDCEIVDGYLYIVNNTYVTLTATYELITYTVEFYLDGALVNEQVVEWNQLFTAPEVGKFGYNFVGWQFGEMLYNASQLVEDTDLVLSFVGFKNLTTINGDTVRLEAVFSPIEYTVTYWDGTSDEPISQIVVHKYDDNFVIDSCSVTKAGYLFAGWLLSGEGATETLLSASEIVSRLTAVEGAELTLTAQWKPITYYVQFYSEGALVATRVAQYDTVVVFPELHVPGYKLVGWDDGNVCYVAGKLVANLTQEDGATVTLTALWQAVSFTVDYQGVADVMPEQQTVLYDNYLSEQPQTFASATRYGYTLVGWNVNGVIYKAGEIIPNLVMERSTVTAEAVWEIVTYSVTFVTNNGAIISKVYYTVQDSVINYPALPEGYSYWEFDGNKLFDDNNPDIVVYATVAEAEVAYYAEFRSAENVLLATFKVEKDADVESIKGLLAVPVRAGYDGDWTYSEQLSHDTTMVFVASYQATQYEIRFLNFDGSVYYVAHYTVEDYDSYVTPAAPAYLCEHGDITHADRYYTYWNSFTLTIGDVEVSPYHVAKVYYANFFVFVTIDSYYGYLDGVNGTGYYVVSYTDENFTIPHIAPLVDNGVTYQPLYWVLDETGEALDDTNAQQLLTFSDEVPNFSQRYRTTSYYVQFVYNNDVDIIEANRELYLLDKFYVQYGITINPYAVPKHPAGFHFAYWYYVDEDGVQREVVFGNSTNSNQVAINKLTMDSLDENSPLLLYPKWEMNVYTLYFEADGGFGYVLTSSFYDTVNGFTPNRKDGFTFLNWKLQLNGEYYNVSTEYVLISDFLRDLYFNHFANTPELFPENGVDLHFVPNWYEHVYNLWFYNFDGYLALQTRVSYTQTFYVSSANSITSVTGHTFQYWRCSNGVNYGADALLSQLTTEDGVTFTFKGQWSVNTHKITTSLSNISSITFKNGSSNGSTLNTSAVPFGTKVYVEISYKYGDSRKVSYSYNGKTVDKGSSTSFTFDMPDYDVTVSASSEDKNCVAPDSLVTLANGTRVRIADLKGDEMLLAWDFMTGEYVVVPIFVLVYHGDSQYIVTELIFSNGSKVNIIGSHGFFDVDENKFVFITDENAAMYIGHNFICTVGNGTDAYSGVTQLIDVKITTEYTGSYSLVSSGTQNFIVDGMLSLTPLLGETLFSFLEIGENMQYDMEALQKDIDAYGLYTYEDWSDYLTYEQYVAFNVAYLKIAVGKGYVDRDELLNLIYTYLKPQN